MRPRPAAARPRYPPERAARPWCRRGRRDLLQVLRVTHFGHPRVHPQTPAQPVQSPRRGPAPCSAAQILVTLLNSACARAAQHLADSRNRGAETCSRPAPQEITSARRPSDGVGQSLASQRAIRVVSSSRAGAPGSRETPGCRPGPAAVADVVLHHVPVKLRARAADRAALKCGRSPARPRTPSSSATLISPGEPSMRCLDPSIRRLRVPLVRLGDPGAPAGRGEMRRRRTRTTPPATKVRGREPPPPR